MYLVNYPLLLIYIPHNVPSDKLTLLLAPPDLMPEITRFSTQLEVGSLIWLKYIVELSALKSIAVNKQTSRCPYGAVEAGSKKSWHNLVLD